MTDQGRADCAECLAGRHSACTGDFSMRTMVTCRCRFCKAYIDEHGPFATPPDVMADQGRDIDAAQTRG